MERCVRRWVMTTGGLGDVYTPLPIKLFGGFTPSMPLSRPRPDRSSLNSTARSQPHSPPRTGAPPREDTSPAAAASPAQLPLFLLPGMSQPLPGRRAAALQHTEASGAPAATAATAAATAATAATAAAAAAAAAAPARALTKEALEAHAQQRKAERERKREEQAAQLRAAKLAAAQRCEGAASAADRPAVPLCCKPERHVYPALFHRHAGWETSRSPAPSSPPPPQSLRGPCAARARTVPRRRCGPPPAGPPAPSAAGAA